MARRDRRRPEPLEEANEASSEGSAREVTADALRGRRWMARSGVGLAVATAAPRQVARLDRRREHEDLAEFLRVPIGRPRAVVADDGTVLHTRVLGKGGGPTFVLTHGLCCDHRLWALQAPALAEHGRVVAWDLRGHGRTAAPPGHQLTPHRHARDLHAVVDALAVGPVILVGHSLGGMTSLRYLLDDQRRSRRVAATVLIATPTADITTSAVSDRGLGRMEAAAFRRLFATVLGSDRVDQTFVTTADDSTRQRGYAIVRTSGFGKRPDPAKVRLIHQMIANTPVDVRRRTFEGMFTEDLRPDLANIDVPALVVIGQQDRVVNPVQTHELARLLPRSTHVEYEDAGHAVVLERHEEITRHTLRLTEHALGSGTVDLAEIAAS